MFRPHIQNIQDGSDLPFNICTIIWNFRGFEGSFIDSEGNFLLPEEDEGTKGTGSLLVLLHSDKISEEEFQLIKDLFFFVNKQHGYVTITIYSTCCFIPAKNMIYPYDKNCLFRLPFFTSTIATSKRNNCRCSILYSKFWCPNIFSIKTLRQTPNRGHNADRFASI